MRKLIPQILSCEKSIQVVGTAIDGSFALKKIAELIPDVITLDLEMPGMTGMQTLREITRKYKLPVIVVSSHTTRGASATFQALALGAFDFVAKPQDASVHMREVAEELINKIRVAAHSELPWSKVCQQVNLKKQRSRESKPLRHRLALWRLEFQLADPTLSSICCPNYPEIFQALF
jgi:two-component system chemotaxis response regulator CheB